VAVSAGEEELAGLISRFDIRLAEILSLKQRRFSGRLSERIGETIA
jgi:hypothetical protein